MRFVVDVYWSMRLPQVARMESASMGYPADECAFYDREPRVTFADTLRRCSPEWQAMKTGAAA